MLLKIDIWLMPAIGAGAASYLVCLIWEHIRHKSAPNGVLAGFLVSLSFMMGALSSYFRYIQYRVSLEENVIVMFTVGVTTTFLWLTLRKYILRKR